MAGIFAVGLLDWYCDDDNVLCDGVMFNGYFVTDRGPRVDGVGPTTRRRTRVLHGGLTQGTDAAHAASTRSVSRMAQGSDRR